MTEEKKIIKQLRDALVMAQQHLEYCGYGDAWERECAFEGQLPEIIQEALDNSE